LLPALICSAVLGLPGCDRTSSPAPPGGKPAPTPPATTATGELARVNDVPITEADLEALSGAAHGQAPSKARDRRVLETIITHELARQEAVRLGLDREPHIKRQLQQIRARAAAQQRRVLYEALMNHELGGEAQVTEQQARAYWDKHGPQLRTSIHVMQILRRDAASIRQAEAALRAGASFEEVARQRPGVKVHGGGHRFWDLGYMRWAQLPLAWREPLRTLQEGQTSGVIRGPASRFWILKVVGRREDSEGTFDGYRSTVLAALRRERLLTRRQQVLDGLRAKARVEFSVAPAGKPK
jgi:peptidyl-prolyl cis-trans isomerase C